MSHVQTLEDDSLHERDSNMEQDIDTLLNDPLKSAMIIQYRGHWYCWVVHLRPSVSKGGGLPGPGLTLNQKP